ncbi:phosphoribosylamine--glycine ligase [Desulfurispira natronophila]|uniref:Phosphoribosylamine--glycine ligase n=1 Tax=Desulfurispira natronophila TaxID=682562 RepID=A0A7W7Y553_9BACT|nr:phosphoribosylamine--glycine ligase [Desulfurispira natronophila]MBB5022104.1 phosphoribosylamine--glycine ligase [Desulfurispira natronophila]
MNILVIGGGGREHALVWKIAQSPRTTHIYCAPGNPGIGQLAQCVDIAVDDIERLADFAADKNVDLTVVGPELPLTEGIVDAFRERGMRIFGPSRAAAELEGSKSYCKMIMEKYHIPTASHRTFRDAAEARRYVESKGAPIVVKASGLAAGKGVTVAFSVDEALEAITSIMEDKVFGNSGDEVVIEDYLAGEEASFLAFCDGKTAVPMVASQDHKQVNEGDTGPNTGGMGAYSPAPILTAELQQRALDEIMQPMVDAMAQEGRPFVGILYGGLMIDGSDIKVLEFNVRFGDPEAQPVLMRLQTDLVDIMEACIDGKLQQQAIQWSDDAAVCVVMASGGYPGSYQKGHHIEGLQLAGAVENVVVFHAGTTWQDGNVVNAGGRVLGVTARHSSLQRAIENAYCAVDCIYWQDAYVRRDIGAKGVARMERQAE